VVPPVLVILTVGLVAVPMTQVEGISVVTVIRALVVPGGSSVSVDAEVMTGVMGVAPVSSSAPSSPRPKYKATAKADRPRMVRPMMSLRSLRVLRGLGRGIPIFGVFDWLDGFSLLNWLTSFSFFSLLSLFESLFIILLYLI